MGIPNDVYNTLVNSNWLFNTQRRLLQADWFILEINGKATLIINKADNFKAMTHDEHDSSNAKPMELQEEPYSWFLPMSVFFQNSANC